MITADFATLDLPGHLHSIYLCTDIDLLGGCAGMQNRSTTTVQFVLEDKIKCNLCGIIGRTMVSCTPKRTTNKGS